MKKVETKTQKNADEIDKRALQVDLVDLKTGLTA
jgi:hypothetical protein